MNIKIKLVIIFAIFSAVVLGTLGLIYVTEELFPREEVPTIREGEIIAENWIKNLSQSYPFYGKGLQIIEREEIGLGEYRFVFTFTTDSPEYGTRESEIVIKTDDIEVVYAVTDGVFDEIENQYIDKQTTATLYFYIREDDEDRLKEVERAVLDEPGKEREVLEMLFEGPNEKEREDGLFSLIDNLEIFSFRVEGEIAYIELDIDWDSVREEAQNQIKKTLTQFNSIAEVRESKKERAVTVVVEGVPEDFFFERELKEGMEGEDVKYLEMILNADPDTMIAETGPGSPGEEAGVFSGAVTNAVMIFQRKYDSEILEPAGLILSSGVVDEYTRDKLNAILEENRWE